MTWGFLNLRRRLQGYSGARSDVVKLIERGPENVLDVGCGAGLTAAMIRRRFPSANLVGVEPDPDSSRLAEQHFDDVLNIGIDDSHAVDVALGERKFDLIILADVLEHLARPEDVLAHLKQRLTENGCIITSIPNVRHWSTFLELGVLGRWPRRHRGIHDRTHLRFFARGDIVQLARGAGLRMETERRNLRLFESQPWSKIPAKLFDFWPLRPFMTFQYLHRWTR